MLPALDSNPRPRAIRILSICAALVLLGAAAYLAIGAYVAFKLTDPQRQTLSSAPAFSALSLESPRIHSRDGLTLASWYLPASGSDRAVVVVHGLNQCRSCEFHGRFVEFGQQLRAQGFDVLMIDLRGHGESEGAHLTMGEEERWDVLGAVDWLQARGLKKIGVLGVSMGAATTVKAAITPNGGEQIGAIALDSCYTSFHDLLEKNFTDATGYPTAIIPGGLLMARVLLHVDLDASQPLNELPHVASPVLLIYGRQDRYITPAQMQAMAGARPNSETWSVDDAGHAGIYEAHPAEYVARVSHFFDQSLH